MTLPVAKKKTFRSHVAMFGHLLTVFQSVAESHFECLPFICHFFVFHALRPEVLKLWGASPGGANCLYEGHIYFELNMGAR
jgi:hypothetical protein